MTTASAAVVGAAVGGGEAAASPAQTASVADYGATGRVRTVSDDGKVEVDLLAGLEGGAARRVVGQASMPLVGFSHDALPRVGDLVGVTRTTPGYDVAAAPLIHRVTGVPDAVGSDEFVVGGERIAGHPALRAAGRASTPLTVAVFDTQLPVARVFAVRPAESR